MSDTSNTDGEAPKQDSVPESTSDSSTESAPEHVSESCTKAPLNPKWAIKLCIITFFVIGFGGLGLYDAVIKYPARGERFADWAKWQYLDAAKVAGTEDFGIFERKTSVADPVEELARLQDDETRRRNAADSVNQSSSRKLRASMYNARFEWLNALDTIGDLSTKHTIIESPRDELDALTTKWTSSISNPKPLKSYDIPSQWLIMILCWGIGGWMLLNIIKVIGQKFSWDAETMTLTVPGAISISPENLEELDKRKWDKFIVFLKLNDTHPTHGGNEIKVDTYQHALVEDWILAMEAKVLGSQQDGE